MDNPPPVVDTDLRFERGFLHPRYAGAWLVIGLVGAFGLLPRRWSMGLGAGMGDLFRRSNAKRRRIVDTNLRLCFPELDDAERERMLVSHFQRYGQSMVDMGLVWRGSTRRLDKLTDYRGREAYLELLKERPVVLITPHVTAMDYGGVMLSRIHPSISMMKPLNNALLNWRIWHGRTRFPPSRVVMRNQGLRPLVRALKQGKACYFIPDGDFGDVKNSVFAPFFGVPTATLTTVSRLARISGAAVVPCAARLLPESGRYEITLEPPLPDFPSGDFAVDATAMNRAFEKLVRRAPEQYLWTLRWFKTRPDGAPSPYD
ncbi:MAG: lysophospholipid acyltransferase family protein [Pseudomonadota bacterium]|nr:lysophospholipid acyltransferase family protein [Pseudomonadota bacterium]